MNRLQKSLLFVIILISSVQVEVSSIIHEVLQQVAGTRILGINADIVGILPVGILLQGCIENHEDGYVILKEAELLSCVVDEIVGWWRHGGLCVLCLGGHACQVFAVNLPRPRRGMTLFADIRKYLFLRQLQNGYTPIPPVWRHRQVVGVHIVKFHGHNIHVRETIDRDNQHLVFISAGRLEGQRPCFMMEMNLEDKTATLIGLERGRTCFIDAHESSKDLVRVAVMIAEQHGIREIEFTDNSTIQCPQKVRLSDLSFLTTGATWYESILPLEYMSEKPIEHCRNIVRTNTWKDVLNRITFLGYTCPFDTAGIDITKPGSAMLVLARAKQQKRFCSYVSQTMDVLLVSSQIPTFHGDHWKATLSTSPHG